MPYYVALLIMAAMAGSAIAQQVTTSEFENITISTPEEGDGSVFIFISEDHDGRFGTAQVDAGDLSLSCFFEWSALEDFVQVAGDGGIPPKRVVASADFNGATDQFECREGSPRITEFAVECSNSTGADKFITSVHGGRTIVQTADGRETSKLESVQAAMDCLVHLNGVDLVAEGGSDGSTFASRDTIRTR